MASQLCKLFLRQKLVTVSSFRNVYLPVRRLQILWSPNEGLKKSFPAVLNKSDSHNHRSKGRDERNWRRPFTYFAVLGVVNATENKQKSPKGNSHICTPSEQDNPPYRFNVRSSNGRFAKRKEKDIRVEHHCKKLKKRLQKLGSQKKTRVCKHIG